MIILQQTRGVFSSDKIDPDAKKYRAALVSAGASVTASQFSAINAFIKNGRTSGWYPLLKRFYLPIWGIAAPNAICMTSLTSGTFNGTVTHAPGHVLSNTTTGYMNTNVGLVTLGLSKDSYHFAGLYRASSSASNSNLFGSQSSGNVSRITCTGSTMSGDMTSTTLGRVTGTVPNADRTGVFTFGGSASNRFLKQRKTSGVATLATTTSTITLTPNNNNVFFLCNNVSGSPSGFCGEQIGAFSIGLELTDAQDTNYTLALKTLWETCTGATLP